MAAIANPESLMVGLYDRGCVQFGDFTLKSGVQSPIYINLRSLGSIDHRSSSLSRERQLEIRQQAIGAYANQVDALRASDHILGIPEAALTIAGMIGAVTDRSVLQMRVKEKRHGQPAGIEGTYYSGERVALLDDLITNGGAKIDAVEKVRAYGLEPVGIGVLVNREQGGVEELDSRGIKLEAAIGINDGIDILRDHNRIGPNLVSFLQSYFAGELEDSALSQVSAIQTYRHSELTTQ